MSFKLIWPRMTMMNVSSYQPLQHSVLNERLSSMEASVSDDFGRCLGIRREMKAVRGPSHRKTHVILWSWSVVSYLCVYVLSLSSANATPALDADQSWGRGAHLSLINPALTIDPTSSLNLSYDLNTPSLDAIQELGTSGAGLDLGHEVHLGWSIPKRYALTLGFSHQPLWSSRQQSLKANRWWSLSQALKVGRLNIGLTLLKAPDEKLLWISGMTVAITPWLITSLTMQDLSDTAITDGELALGVGIKPTSATQLGVTLTPAKGGGALDLRGQWTLWRGLALELGWVGIEGSGYESGRATTWGLLRSPSIRTTGVTTTQQSSLWRFGLSWRGPWGWRAESAASRHSSAQVALRLRSRTPTDYHSPRRNRVFIVNASNPQELSSSPQVMSTSFSSSPFLNILRNLDAIQRQSPDEVEAVVIVLGGQVGWAQAEELREAINALRVSNHLVFAYLPRVNLKNYLIAASCDAIWVSPTAEVALHGLLVERFYLREIFDRLEVTPEVVTAGEYKSAPEVFTRRAPSPEAEEVDQRLLDARFATLVNGVAYRAQQQAWSQEPSPALTRGKRLIALRKLRENEPPTAKERARAISWLKEGPYSAASALKRGLVDRIVSPVDLETTLSKSFPHAKLTAARLPVPTVDWAPDPQIAVIHAIGQIGAGIKAPGKREPMISAARYLPLIKRAMFDPWIRGVVLRVDSPGGVITDADLLWVELRKLAQRKPLAVSMGNVAASGGYYIAAPAHKIFASQSTITGSIGVFVGKLDLSGFLERWGIQVHRMKRGEGGEVQSFLTPWSEQTQSRVKREIEQVYQLFLKRITTARSALSHEQLLPLAGGRVWTGEEALERDLIDVEGGLLDAIKWVTAEARLTHRKHRLISLTPRERSLLSVALGALGLSTFTSAMSSEVAFDIDTLLETQHALFTAHGVLELIIREIPSATRAAVQLMLLAPQQPLALDPRF